MRLILPRNNTMKYVPAAINVKYFMPQNAGPKIGGVTLHIFAVIKLKCAVIKSKLCSVKNYS